ncbi:MAG: hypothetical protein EPO16_00420 [Dehalococcoidia bacterium]|nr:MAG: hypothetical protein EPO16_00420 [Dehalococcoidia bacterium]
MTQQPTTIHFDAERLGDFELAADVGNPYSPDGATRAVLAGTGEVVVTHRRLDLGKPGEGGQDGEQVGTHRLGPDATRTLVARASTFVWGAPFPARPGIPDEPVITWTLSDRRGGQVTLKAWLRDVERDERMAPVLTTLRQAVDAATDGRHYL